MLFISSILRDVVSIFSLFLLQNFTQGDRIKKTGAKDAAIGESKTNLLDSSVTNLCLC